MTQYEIDTYEYKSGLTQKEAEALVDKLANKYLNEYSEKNDTELCISMLKHHLSRCVRDYKDQRTIIASLI
jgi:hypothetical protein